MRYPALELGQAEKPSCPDKFNEESTLLCPGATRLILQVAANTVMVQCGVMQHGVTAGLGGIQWQHEEPYYAGIAASLGRKFDAVRVRNWKAGAEAEVFIAVA